MNKIKLFFQKNNKDVKKENNKEKFDYFKIVIITFLIVFLFNMFCLQTACVNGSSMYPTLENGQYLLINKMEKDYDRYDIIVARSDRKSVV